MKLFWIKAYPVLRNKFVFTGLAFFIWMSFFDENNLIDQFRSSSRNTDLEESMEFYVEEIEKSKDELNVLATDQERLERFARERYLMKKENEEIFVLTTQ